MTRERKPLEITRSSPLDQSNPWIVSLKSDNSSGGPPVTGCFHIVESSTLPVLRVQSDGLGSYQSSPNTLESIIQAIGDWELDMLNFDGSGRMILVDLREPVSGSAPGGADPTIPFTPQLVRAKFIAKCSEYGGNMITMQTGWTITCPLALRFDQDGRSYRMNFNPNNFPNIDPLQVTCVASDGSGKCGQWTIVPSVLQPDASFKSRGKLLRLAASKRETDQDMGNFLMSFKIHLVATP